MSNYGYKYILGRKRSPNSKDIFPEVSANPILSSRLSFHSFINTLQTISVISKKNMPNITPHLHAGGGVASIFIENKQHGTIKGIFTAFGHSSHWRHEAPEREWEETARKWKEGGVRRRREEGKTEGGGGLTKKARASSSLVSSPHQHAPSRASLAVWFAQKNKSLTVWNLSLLLHTWTPVPPLSRTRDNYADSDMSGGTCIGFHPIDSSAAKVKPTHCTAPNR